MIDLLTHFALVTFFAVAFIGLCVLARVDSRSHAARRRRSEPRQITGYRVGARQGRSHP